MNGNRLQELRERFGYSRNQLAEKLLVTSSMIQSWEEGWALINPSKGEIDTMAELFQMAEDELREYLDADEDEDWSADKKLLFVDVLDASIRLHQHIKSLKNGKLLHVLLPLPETQIRKSLRFFFTFRAQEQSTFHRTHHRINVHRCCM